LEFLISCARKTHETALLRSFYVLFQIESGKKAKRVLPRPKGHPSFGIAARVLLFSFLRALRSCLEYSRGRAFFALPSRICFWGFSPAVRFFFELLSLRVLLLAVLGVRGEAAWVLRRARPQSAKRKKMYFSGKRRVFPYFVPRET
jgi:hypothetical protein